MNCTTIVSGAFYMVLGILPIPLYLRMLWVLLARKEFRKNECFFLISQVGICDFLMIVGQSIFGIRIASSYLLVFTEYVAVPVFASSWIAMLAMNFVLAVNRLKVLCNVYIPSKTIIALLAVAWLFGLFFFFSYATRTSPLVTVDGLSLFYDVTVPYAVLVQKIEFYGSMALIGASLLVYQYIIGSFAYQRCHGSGAIISRSTAEFRLLTLSAVEFVSCACLDMAWHFGDLFLPDSEWTGTAVNALIIFHCGWINPGLSMLLSRKLRHAVFSVRGGQVDPSEPSRSRVLSTDRRC
uniref:G protein-coupled receptor n=1 Tax=Steinernema glaseri TaxID=37863 RepID=A0A1I7YKB4_9BILA